MKNYVIVTKSDSNFFKGIVALLESIKVHEKSTPVVVIDCGFTTDEIDYIKRQGCIVKPANISDFKIPEIKNYYTPAIYAFLTLEPLNYDIMVHLDADALLLGSLDEIVEKANDHGLAAVPDHPYLYIHSQIKDEEAQSYITKLIPDIDLEKISFNAGVFAVKSDYFHKKMKPIAKKLFPIHEKLYGNDQAILNISALHANPQEPFRNAGYHYNTRPSYTRSPETPPLKIFKKELGMAAIGIGGEAKILHFVSRQKPWKSEYDRNCPGFKVWDYYYNLAKDIPSDKSSQSL